MNNSKLKVGILQLCSIDDISTNVTIILSLLNSLLEQDKSVDIVSLPENCLYMRLDRRAKLQAIDVHHPELVKLKNWVDQSGIALHLGGVAFELNHKNYNSCLWLEPNKEIQCTYQKMHLFDIDLKNGHSYFESDSYTRGLKPQVIEYRTWKIGQAICYDLRFSPLYQYYKEQQVDLILTPSSFLVPTGEAHWHILNRARAIETQSYIISSAQSGNHKDKHQSYGHSLAIDPWGNIICDLKSKSSQFEIVELDKSLLDKTRMQMPMSLNPYFES